MAFTWKALVLSQLCPFPIVFTQKAAVFDTPGEPPVEAQKSSALEIPSCLSAIASILNSPAHEFQVYSSVAASAQKTPAHESPTHSSVATSPQKA